MSIPWTMNLNLAGVPLISGLSQELPPGPLHCKTRSSEPHTSAEGGASIQLECVVMEPAALVGQSALMFITDPALASDEKAKKGRAIGLKQALASHGHDPAKMDGPFAIANSTFEGRDCYIFVKPTAPGSQYKTDRKFITKADYEAALKNPMPAQASAPAAASNGAAASAPQAPQPGPASQMLL